MSDLIVPLIMCGGAGTRLWPARRDGDPVLLALAADHVVTDPAGFIAACCTARAAARAGHLVTFGVRPDRPATEYGYIRPGAAGDGGISAVERFVEKPNAGDAA